MPKKRSSIKRYARVIGLALSLVACDDPTRSEPIVSQFSASISGAFTDLFEATRDTVANSEIRVVHFLPPGHINIIAIRRGVTEADFISFNIDVRSSHQVQPASGGLVLNIDTTRLFELELDVEVTRLTSNRLTGVFTGVGVESALPDSVSPDTIQLSDGQFDIVLKEPIPQP